MKKIVSFLAVLMCFGVLNAQYSEEEVATIVNQGWRYMDSGIKKDSALLIVQQLKSICAEQGIEKACLNTHQLMGEYHYFSGAVDSALYYYSSGLDAAQAVKNTEEVAYCQASLGGVYSALGKNSEALEYFEKALEYRVQVGDTANTLHILLKRAWLYLDEEWIDSAMAECVEALNYAERANDTYNIARVYGCMAVIFEKQNHLDKALEYLEKSSDEYRKTDYRDGVESNKVNMAIILKNLGRYEEALELLQDALEYFTSINAQFGVMSVYANMAVVLNRDGQYEKAIAIADSTLNNKNTFYDKVTQSDMFNEKGIAYLGLGQPKKALSFSTEAVAVLDSVTGSLEKLKDAEKTLSDIYAELGDNKQALEHYRTFSALNDSIFETKRSNQMLRLEEQYESQKKEREIAMLSAEKQLADTKRKALLYGLIGVILLSVLIINREYQRKKKARALHASELKLAESERSRLQDQLDFKNRELTAQALHIAQKNEMLNAIKSELQEAKKDNDSNFAQGVIHKINLDSQIDRNWDQFIQMFTETNADFLQTISTRYPDVSKNELRLCALIKMNLTNKDIGTILNISDDGVKKARYRLRKKMKLETNDSLEQVILNI